MMLNSKGGWFRKCVFLTVILLQFYTSLTEKEHYYGKNTNFKCKDIDEEHILNSTCYIRAMRHKNGLLNIRFMYRNAENVMTQVRFLRRNNLGRYQIYLVDVMINCCDLKQYFEGGNEIIKRILSIFTMHDSSLTNGCPLNGFVNYTDTEWDDKWDRAFPPIIPAGTYIVNIRIYNGKTNKTYIDFRLTTEVKPKGAIDLSMLNMG